MFVFAVSRVPVEESSSPNLLWDIPKCLVFSIPPAWALCLLVCTPATFSTAVPKNLEVTSSISITGRNSSYFSQLNLA